MKGKKINIKKIWNNIKKFFVKLWKKLIKLLIKLKNNFMKLKPTVRYIIYVWFAVFVILVLFIIIAGSNNKIINEHKEIENAISSATLDYYKENSIYPTSAEAQKLSVDMLVNYNYLNKNDITDSTCKGYSMTYYDDLTGEYDIKVYISCEKYVTDGYKA